MANSAATRSAIRVGMALGGVALLLLCAPPLSNAKAAEAGPGSHADFEGVWEAVGGANFEPGVRDLPDNKGRSSSEWRDYPPYNAAYEARYTKIIADIRKGKAVEDASANCLPQGMPRMMVINYPIDVIVQPNRVVMLFEPLSQRRIINTDGRGHSDPADLDPTFSGESIGRWEGDTLVVDTIGIREDIAFDVSVAPHSDAMHFSERIQRVGDMLEDQFVVEDPKAFTRPWHVTRLYKRHPGLELKEYVCENTRKQ